MDVLDDQWLQLIPEGDIFRVLLLVWLETQAPVWHL